MGAASRPSTRAQRSAGRARLSAGSWIAAGHRLMIDGGIPSVKIDAMANVLGVTKGSFYWHYTNLAVFLQAMVAHFISDQEAVMDAFTRTAPEDPRELLLALMDHIADPHLSALEQAMRAWAYEEDDLHIHLQRVDAWVYRLLRGAFERLGFAGHDADLRAKTLYCAGVGRVQLGALGDPERAEDRGQLLDMLGRR